MNINLTTLYMCSVKHELLRGFRIYPKTWNKRRQRVSFHNQMPVKEKLLMLVWEIILDIKKTS